MPTGKPGRPPYGYKLTEAGLSGPKDDRTPHEEIVDLRVERILRAARGKPLSEDQIFAEYKTRMAPAEKARRKLRREAAR